MPTEPTAVNTHIQNLNNNRNNNQEKQLPQTGDDHNPASVLALLGISFAGLLGFADKKKRQN